MLGRTGRWIAVVVVMLAVLVLAGAVAVVVRWEDVKAWLDAPDVLAAEDAVRDVALPAGFEEDPTRSGCAPWGSSRCAWTDLPPQEAAESLAERLRAAGVELGDVRCDVPEAGPEGMSVGAPQCGATATVQGADLWLQAIDRTPSGDVPLGRTAVWAVWDGSTMSMPLWERLWAHQGGPRGEVGPPTAAEVEALLPDWLAGATGEPCTSGGPGTCTAWEVPLDAAALPGGGEVEALVHDLVAAGYFVSVADPTHAAPIQAHRFTGAGEWTGVDLVIRDWEAGPVALVTTF